MKLKALISGLRVILVMKLMSSLSMRIESDLSSLSSGRITISNLVLKPLERTTAMFLNVWTPGETLYNSKFELDCLNII